MLLVKKKKTYQNSKRTSVEKLLLVFARLVFNVSSVSSSALVFLISVVLLRKQEVIVRVSTDLML